MNGLTNPGNNTCFVNAVVQVMAFIRADLLVMNPVPAGPQSPVQILQDVFSRMVAQRAIGTNPPFPTVQLLASLLNANPRAPFVVGQQGDSRELIANLLTQLNFVPDTFTTFPLEGNCAHRTIRTDETLHFKILILDFIQNPAPLGQDASISDLIAGQLAQPHNMFCHCICPPGCNDPTSPNCVRIPVVGNVTINMGNITIIGCQRNDGNNIKLFDKLQHIPAAQVGALPGQELNAVLCHQGQFAGNGHWMAYVKLRGRWFKLNDSQPVQEEDPFITQLNPATLADPNQRLYGHTIDILIFS